MTQKKRMVYSSYLRKSTTNADKDINMQIVNGGKNRPRINQQVALINKHKSSIGFHQTRKPQQHVQRLANASRNMAPKKQTDYCPQQKVKPVNQDIFNKVLQDLSVEQNLISSSTQKRNKHRIQGLQSAKSNSQIPVTPSSNKASQLANMQLKNQVDVQAFVQSNNALAYSAARRTPYIGPSTKTTLSPTRTKVGKIIDQEKRDIFVLPHLPKNK